MRLFAILPLTLLVACGDDGGSSIDARQIDANLNGDAVVIDGPPIDAPIDAPPMIDAMQTVLSVTCPASPDASITVAQSGSAFEPSSVTIAQNEIVEFDMTTEDAMNHNVVPLTTQPSDPGLRVNYNEKKCLQFTATGTFHFKCMPHGFEGSVTVQ